MVYTGGVAASASYLRWGLAIRVGYFKVGGGGLILGRRCEILMFIAKICYSNEGHKFIGALKNKHR